VSKQTQKERALMDEQSKTEQPARELTLREAMLPEKVRLWRATLSTKAKQQKRWRFYSLYGLISHPETLRAAWQQVRANAGAPGVDGISFAQIEAQGVEPWLEQLGQELRNKTYRCQWVRRVYIPKANGKLRPLGIPTIRDRVVQCAVLLILEPIFEADFEDCSYGFRPERNAHQALEKIREHLRAGKCEIYDADLEGYFDSIPHDKLMACLRMRVVDGSVLRLIREWLKAPVVEYDEQGKKKRVRRQSSGTPQGGVLSPLLANIYLHWFDRIFRSKQGPAKWANAALVRYADDFVVLARHLGSRIETFITQKLENWLGLKINRQKTRVVKLRTNHDRLEFLGYQIGLATDLRTRTHYYWRLEPSDKALRRELDKLRAMTAARYGLLPLAQLIRKLNRHLKGWANYYRFGQPRLAFRTVNTYLRRRLYRLLRRRSQRRWKASANLSSYRYFQQRGLLYL
jgi:RNA-directed DNA polymerase